MPCPGYLAANQVGGVIVFPVSPGPASRPRTRSVHFVLVLVLVFVFQRAHTARWSRAGAVLDFDFKYLSGWHSARAFTSATRSYLVELPTLRQGIANRTLEQRTNSRTPINVEHRLRECLLCLCTVRVDVCACVRL